MPNTFTKTPATVSQLRDDADDDRPENQRYIHFGHRGGTQSRCPANRGMLARWSVAKKVTAIICQRLLRCCIDRSRIDASHTQHLACGAARREQRRRRRQWRLQPPVLLSLFCCAHAALKSRQGHLSASALASETCANFNPRRPDTETPRKQQKTALAYVLTFAA